MESLLQHSKSTRPDDYQINGNVSCTKYFCILMGTANSLKLVFAASDTNAAMRCGILY